MLVSPAENLQFEVDVCHLPVDKVSEFQQSFFCVIFFSRREKKRRTLTLLLASWPKAPLTSSRTTISGDHWVQFSRGVVNRRINRDEEPLLPMCVVGDRQRRSRD